MNSVFVLLENRKMSIYELNGKDSWEIGRPSSDNEPDIKLYAPSVSRKHGKLQMTDGIWFYLDYNKKNGTLYNSRHIDAGINGRIRPVILEDGDVLQFGCRKNEGITDRTTWGMYLTKDYDGITRVEDTKGKNRYTFSDGQNTSTIENPQTGTVIKMQNGLGICMGDTVYLLGTIELKTA